MRAEFGYDLLPSDLDGPNPKLTEHEIDWHLTYSEVFRSAGLRRAVAEKPDRYRKRYQEKGVFSALYEFFGKEQ